jgi:hypothetical protein
MGIFSEADQHPFVEREIETVDEAHGGSSVESWLEEQQVRDFVRSSERPRGLFVRDDILLS